jgi:hypothetical protein
LDDWFAAANLNSALARPGHEQLLTIGRWRAANLRARALFWGLHRDVTAGAALQIEGRGLCKCSNCGTLFLSWQ